MVKQLHSLQQQQLYSVAEPISSPSILPTADLLPPASTPLMNISTTGVLTPAIPSSSGTGFLPPASTPLVVSNLNITNVSTPGLNQSLVNIGGKSVLVSGSGPAQIGSKSVRWGRILKGQYKFFCFRCKKPFTAKADCFRHEQTNCKLLKEGERKTYDCETCGEKKTSKQYLKEHINEVHLKTFSYYCKTCTMGFYKHSKLVFHNKTCAARLVVTTTSGLFAGDNPDDPDEEIVE